MKVTTQTLSLPVSTSSVANANVTAATAATAIDLSAADGQVWLQVVGALSATYILETSLDGVTWMAAAKQFFNVADLTAFAGFSATNLMAQTVPGVGGGLALFRVRCTAYVSGTPSLIVTWRDTRTP